MNPDQQTRLEIMKALEKEFPDRLLEDLTEVARYVEGGGIEQAREESQDSAAKTSWEAAYISEPRTWTNLDAIPSSVKAITDRDGHRAEPQTIKGQREWVFTDEPFGGLGVSLDDAPFTEVLS